MNGFLSFLAQDSQNPLQDEGDFDVFQAQVEDLVFAYLRRHIRTYRPSYTFEQVRDNILSTDVADDFITFTLRLPDTGAIECFGFGIDTLEDIREETRKSVQRICYDGEYIERKIFSISPETMRIIHSHYPEIRIEGMLGVSIMPFDDGTTEFEYSAHDDYLELYYLWEDNKVEFLMLPNVLKWEHLGTNNGIMQSMGRDRRRILRLLTQKNYRFF